CRKQPHKGCKDGGIATPEESIAPPRDRGYISTDEFGVRGEWDQLGETGAGLRLLWL
ncbi:hypothetical protein A2U01_0095744, partial [Trifolium medium]|nr:hypothetical protein [Trifolium medium]